MNLYILNENITNGFQSLTLNFITLTAILCGIFVIVSKNPIVSVLFLIGLFLSISIYLMLLGINFIGLSYLLVYVGAVSILFLFILMLINIRISEIISSTSNSIPLAIIIGTLFFSTVYQALPLTIAPVIFSNKEYNALPSGFAIIRDEMKKYFYSLYDLFTGITASPATNLTLSYYDSKDQSLELVSSQA